MSKGCGNSLRPVQDTEEILSLTFPYRLGPTSNVLQDSFRVLFTRIIIRNHAKIRQLGDDTSHKRAFLDIASARSAKDGHQPACSKRAQRGQDFLQAIGRVGKIDDHAKGL